MPRKKKKTEGINALGDLEMDIMGIVWNRERTTVKDVFEIMYQRRGLAYTTIMTVMNRLAIKGILEQDKSTVPYVYAPLIQRDQIAHSMVDDVVNRVMGGSPTAVISYLMGRGTLSKDELSELKDKLAEIEKAQP